MSSLSLSPPSSCLLILPWRVPAAWDTWLGAGGGGSNPNNSNSRPPPPDPLVASNPAIQSGLRKLQACREQVRSCLQDDKKDALSQRLMEYAHLLDVALRTPLPLATGPSGAPKQAPSDAWMQDGWTLTWEMTPGTTAITGDATPPLTFVRPPTIPADEDDDKRDARLWHSVWQSVVSWEMANVVWNLAVCEISTTAAGAWPPTNKMVWKKAGSNWQTAASWLQYLLQGNFLQALTTPGNPTSDPLLHTGFLQCWEALLEAEAQRAAYQFLAVAPRPSAALLLAKLASGCVPLYHTLVQHCERATASSIASLLVHAADQQLQLWFDAARAWHMVLAALAEFHQSALHESKKQTAPAQARKDRAFGLGQVARDFVSRLEPLTPPPSQGSWSELHILVYPPASVSTTSLFAVLPESAAGTDNAAGSSDLPDIAPQTLVKVNVANVTKLLAKVAATNGQEGESPLFSDLQGTAREYRDTWQSDLNNLWEETAKASDQQTEYARQSLAEADLPQALTMYQQRNNQQGAASSSSSATNAGSSSATSKALASAASHDPNSPLPLELWERIQRIQLADRNQSSDKGNDQQDEGDENRAMSMNQLQQGLWELRDTAEQAHELCRDVAQQLDGNVRLDADFRLGNKDYKGHNVDHIQASFRETLDNYSELLHSAETGDKVLFGRLSTLPTDAKFQLLNLSKPQLERLLKADMDRNNPQGSKAVPSSPPPAKQETPSAQIEATVNQLSRSLVELSSLFQDRERLIHDQLPQVIDESVGFVTQQMMDGPPDNGDYEGLIQQTQPQIQQVLDEIQENFRQQNDIMTKIMNENKIFSEFIKNNSNGGSSTADAASSAPAAVASRPSRTLVMLHEALDEMEELQHHWVQGKGFYKVVIPKLQKLQHQVSEVSTRLAIDRCEYEETLFRTSQMAKDAEMAASLEDKRKLGEAEGDQQVADGRVMTVRQDDAGNLVRIDDEKVANLVAMDFDPDAVVKALTKYDNDVEQALNELLAG